MKRIVLIWIIGFAICMAVTVFLVIMAYGIREKWAFGGEYCGISVMIIVCTSITRKIRLEQQRLKEIEIKKPHRYV